MSAQGAIVGYITRPNGSPISGAEIYLGETRRMTARTDERGYFQLLLVDGETDAGKGFCGVENLKVSVGTRKGVRINSENSFQVTGYLISEILKPEVGF